MLPPILCENLCSLNPNEVHLLHHTMYQIQAAWFLAIGKVDTVCCMAPEYEGRGKVLNIFVVCSVGKIHLRGYNVIKGIVYMLCTISIFMYTLSTYTLEELYETRVMCGKFQGYTNFVWSEFMHTPSPITSFHVHVYRVSIGSGARGDISPSLPKRQQKTITQ